MPTILRQSGFSVMIYTKDHAPMHVHVKHQGNVAIIEFEDEVTLRNNYGFNRRQLKQALLIVTENRQMLIERWREIYG